MDEVVAMTVPLPLPSKNQTQELNQAVVAVGQQTVSIRTVSLPLPRPRVEATGATVIIGGSVPAADATATCSKHSVPETQSAKKHTECLQQEQKQRNQHVVKIRINPDNDNSKVISSVRLNLDKNEKNCDKPNGVVLVCNSTSLDDDSPGCVRISVVKKNNINNDKNQHYGKNDMIQDNAQEGNTSNCFYYGTFPGSLANMVMSSGQCSPSDTLDSGTCSDLDGTPPPLPKKNSSTILLGGDVREHSHHRTGSLTSSGADADSDDDDDNRSNISCDSLNSGELLGTHNQVNGNPVVSVKGIQVQQHATSFDTEDSESNSIKVGEVVEVARRMSTKLDIVLVSENGSNFRNKELETNSHLNYLSSTCTSLGNSNFTSTFSSEDVSSIPRVSAASPSSVQETRDESWTPIVKECTYEERKQEQQEQLRIGQEFSTTNYLGNFNNCSPGTKYVYDDDRFYKFHMNERCCDEKTESMVIGNDVGESDKENEYFAGFKILEREAIRSAKGTVRGVKNRVRAGIATFLQIPSTKNYKAKDAGKVVVYTTTMGIVRETYYACMKVKQILRTHLVKYEERDMFMSTECQTELKDRIGSTTIQVPQLFIDGQFIGDADTVERLNESGELRLMLKPYKSADACTTCKICGGYRLLPCSVCNGSKKSVHRNDFTTEFVALKCMNCNEVGLVRCQHC